MEWIGIGEDLPVEDGNGYRPDFDDDGVPRELEFVPYGPLKDIEIQIKSMSSVSDRRWLEALIENMAQRRGFSITVAMDIETGFLQAIKNFVLGVRHKESGKTIEGDDAAEALCEHAEHEDRIPILMTLKRQCDLAKSKKKNWNSRFGLPTS